MQRTRRWGRFVSQKVSFATVRGAAEIRGLRVSKVSLTIEAWKSGKTPKRGKRDMRLDRREKRRHRRPVLMVWRSTLALLKARPYATRTYRKESLPARCFPSPAQIPPDEIGAGPRSLALHRAYLSTKWFILSIFEKGTALFMRV